MSPADAWQMKVEIPQVSQVQKRLCQLWLECPFRIFDLSAVALLGLTCVKL
jgi:hypothetical protein